MLEGIDVGMSIRVEKGRGNISGGDTPITDHFSVDKDNGPENTAIVMGAMAMVGMQGNVTALISDQVLVIWRKQMHASMSEPPGTAITMKKENTAFPTFLDKFVSKQGYSQTAIVESKAAPPREILDSGGAMTPIVFPGQDGQGFFPGQSPRRRKFRIYQSIAFLEWLKVSAAKHTGILRQADMI